MDFKVYKIKPTNYKKLTRTLFVLTQVSATTVIVGIAYGAIPLVRVAAPAFTILATATLLCSKKRVRLSKWNMK